MSDAIHQQSRDEKENIAKNAFFKTTIEYLHTPTPEKKIEVEEKMKEYAQKLRGRFEENIKNLQKIFQRLETNDHTLWKEVNRQEKKDLFRNDPQSKKLFLEAAQSRKLGSMQWII